MTQTERHKVLVTCPNGRSVSFATWDEAQSWAEWGHACMSEGQHIYAEAVGVGGYYPLQSTDPRHSCVVHPRRGA